MFFVQLVASAPLRAEDDAKNTEAAKDTLRDVLRPSILTDIAYRTYSSIKENSSGFAIMHLRPGLTLTPNAWFKGVANVEFAGEYARILDAFASIQATQDLEVTVGYSEPALFGAFTDVPYFALTFHEFAPTVDAFRVYRDVGVDLRFAPRTLPFEARVRIGNGTGSALGNDNSLPAAYAALDLVLGRAHRSASPENMAPGAFGLRVGASGLLENVRDRNGIVGQTPLDFVYYRPAIVSNMRAIGETHAILYTGPLRLSLTAALAHEERSRDHDGNPDTPRLPLDSIHSYGLGAELAYALLGVPHFPGASLPTLEVAARFDLLKLGLGTEQVTPGGARAGAITLKWWPTSFLSTSLSAYLNHFDTLPVENPTSRYSYNFVAHTSFTWGGAD